MNGWLRSTLDDKLAPTPFKAVALVLQALAAIEFVAMPFAGLVCLSIPGRGLPGGKSLFFCFVKSKVTKRKDDPQSGALRATCEMGGNRGSAQTCLRLRQRAALLPISTYFTGPARTGFGGNSGSKFCSFSCWKEAGSRATNGQRRKKRPEPQTDSNSDSPRPILC